MYLKTRLGLNFSWLFVMLRLLACFVCSAAAAAALSAPLPPIRGVPLSLLPEYHKAADVRLSGVVTGPLSHTVHVFHACLHVAVCVCVTVVCVLWWMTVWGVVCACVCVFCVCSVWCVCVCVFRVSVFVWYHVAVPSP